MSIKKVSRRGFLKGLAGVAGGAALAAGSLSMCAGQQPTEEPPADQASAEPESPIKQPRTAKDAGRQTIPIG